MRAFEVLKEVKKPSLEDFLRGKVPNLHVYFKSSKGVGLVSYVRKGPRYVNGTTFDNVLDRASTSITNDKMLMKMFKNDTPMANSGAYREFDGYMLELAKQYGFDGIYVENVLNYALRDVLLRYGYKLVANTTPPSYWKKL